MCVLCLPIFTLTHKSLTFLVMLFTCDWCLLAIDYNEFLSDQENGSFY